MKVEATFKFQNKKHQIFNQEFHVQKKKIPSKIRINRIDITDIQKLRE